MNKFDSKIIYKRRIQAKLSYRSLSALTRNLDPENKGVSAMTCHRIETDLKPSIVSLMLICDALGISAKSTFSRTTDK